MDELVMNAAEFVDLYVEAAAEEGSVFLGGDTIMESDWAYLVVVPDVPEAVVL